MKLSAKFNLVFVLCLVALVGAQAAVLAADIWVSTTGSDILGNGTYANPYATIDYADHNSLLMAGDTVHVMAGIYERSGTANVVTIGYCAGTVSSPITYKAEGDVTVKLTGANTTVAAAWAVDNMGWSIAGAGSGHSNNIVIDGFTMIDDRTVNSEACFAGYGANITLMNNTIIKNNSGGSGTVDFYSGQALKMHNNVIGSNAGGSYGLSLRWPNGGLSQEIYNNTFYGIGNWAIACNGGSNQTKFINNIVEDSAYGLWAGDGNVHTNNLFNCNVPSLTYQNTTQDPTELVGVDPMLNADLTLMAGSPAIGAGIDVGFGTDLGAFPYVVPEPGTISALAVGLLGLGGLRLRRKS